MRGSMSPGSYETGTSIGYSLVVVGVGHLLHSVTFN